MSSDAQLWIGALAGTIVGFVLVVGYEHWKDWRRARQLRAGIREELRGNLYMFPMKADTAKRADASLRQGQLMDAQSTPFMREVYDSDPVLLVTSLRPLERNLLHLVYDRFAAINWAMASFANDVTNMQPTTEAMVVRRYSSYFGEFETLFAETERLVLSYLNGKPDDVFHLELKWEDYKGAPISLQRPKG